ncbi:phage minor capsid protein [[Ruminococcus] torques]|nr:phage minor capsid protein [[Ruminococcus] torques]
MYQKYLDAACMDIVSGAFDYNTVLRRTVTHLTNSGLRQIDYASGRANRVDVAARRAVMTGVSQLSGKISEMNAEKLGTEHFEVEWHAGARPTHAVWQGRVYSKEELTTVCGLGSVTGLLGANCYHMYYPFVPGISVRNWTDEWLEEQNRKENTPNTFNGKEYTLYEAKQRQRQMETCMRAQREKVDLLKKGGADPDDIMIARAKYQGQLNEYSRFCKKMGLTEERERIYYDMRGRVATNTKKQNRKYTTDMIRNADRDSKQYYRYRNILGDDVGSLADFRQMKYNEPKKFSALKKKVDTYSDIDKKEWSSEFKQKSKEAYVRFEKEGIYLSVHALSRLPRLNQPGLPEVSEEVLMKFINGIPKYTEGENKLVYFDAKLQLVAIKNKITGDIVSVVRRKNPKEVWENV